MSRRLIAVASALLVLTVVAPAHATHHVLTGTDSRGHAARLVVDEHLHPISAHLSFGTTCPSPEHPTLDITRLDVHLVDERMEDGVLHRHWSGSHLNPHDGRVFGPLAVHVSRHADGSVHAEGSASFEDVVRISAVHRPRRCLFGSHFVVSEAPG